MTETADGLKKAKKEKEWKWNHLKGRNKKN